MKIASYFLLVLVMAWPRLGFSQATGNTTTALFAGVPTGTCNPTARVLALNTSNGDLYSCRNGAWGLVASGALPLIAPGDTIFGNNTVSTGAPSFFQASGDLSFGGGSFSVNRLHFGPTALTLSNTGIATGNCLQVSGLTVIGGACGTGGGGGSGTVTSFSSGSLSPLFTTSVATASTTPALSFTFSQAPANTMLGNNTTSAAVPSWVPIPTGGGGGTLQGCSTPSSGNLVCNNSVTGGTGTVGLLTIPYTGALPAPPSTVGQAGITANSTGVYWSPGNNTAFIQIGTGGGGGGVSSVSAGSLAPIFTTNVANATTTPNISFSLSTAPANTMLGNNSASAAAPNWVAIPAGGAGGPLGGVIIVQ